MRGHSSNGRAVGRSPARSWFESTCPHTVVAGSTPAGRPTSMRGLDLALRGITLIVGLSCVGCVRETDILTQPTSATRTVGVTVRALRYQTDSPVQGAMVAVDGHESGTTQADGAVRVQVPLGRETTISVTKYGYESMLPWAAGTVNAEGETWTFYLRPALDH